MGLIEKKWALGASFVPAALLGGLLFTAGCQTKEVMDKRSYEPVDKSGQLPTAVETAPSKDAPKTNAVEAPPFDNTLDAPAPVTPAAAGEYVVKRGDSLSKIAQKYGVPVHTLAAYNNIELKSILRIGQKIRIPAPGTYSPVKKVVHAKKSAKPSGKKAAVKNTAAAAASGNVYVVKANDSVDRIARKLKVKRADLMQANNLTASSILRIGQKLTVPGASATAGKPAAVTTPAQTADTTATVEKPVAAPQSAEGTQAPTETVTTTTTTTVTDEGAAKEQLVFVEADTTIQDFAAKYKVSADELRKKNTEIVGDQLKSGTMLVLPAGASK